MYVQSGTYIFLQKCTKNVSKAFFLHGYFWGPPIGGILKSKSKQNVPEE